MSVFLWVGIFVGSALAESWVMFKLWAWHFVPLGLPAIPYATAVAFSLLVTMLTSHCSPYGSDDEKKVIVRILSNGFVLPVLALAIGWSLR